MIVKSSGIYSFVNWSNGKRYVGSAVNLFNRNKNHKLLLKLNKHYNRYLQAAWNKYGEQNILFEVLELVSDKTYLIEREQFWIDEFNSADRNFGYNLSPTAGSPLGVKHTEEAKANMSEAGRNKIRTEEWNKNISIGLTGLKVKDSARQSISKALKGRTLSTEHSEKIANYHRNLDKWPCPQGYYCSCKDCKAKRADITRRYRIRKSQMENENGSERSR